MSVCSICLRTNLTVNTVNQVLITFYDALLETEEMNPTLSACANCERLLKKCYDFKQLCQKSKRILQDWKKKKKTESPTENLHYLIQPYYDKVFETDEKQIKTESGIVNTIVITNDKPIPNKDAMEINYNEIEVKFEDISHKNDNKESTDNTDVVNNDVCDNDVDNNDVLTETNVQNFPVEPKKEAGLNISDDESNGTGDVSDNDDDSIYNDSDNDLDDDSIDSEDLGSEDRPLKGLKKKSKGIKKKRGQQTSNTSSNQREKIDRRKRKERKPLQNKEKFESIFDIIYFKTDEEAKAELLERPNTEYYKNAEFKCTECYSVCKCQKLLDYHMKWHDPSAGEHFCDVCRMRFRTRRSMMYHKNTAHFGRYSCKLCSLITYHKSVMIRHCEVHENIQYKCKFCDGTYNQKSVYLSHLRLMHSSQHACPLCARMFISLARLKQHKALVHQTTAEMELECSVKCDECNMTFSNQDVYTVHVMNTPCHKDIASAMIACAACGSRFDDVQSLREHKRQMHPFQRKNKRRRREKIEVTCKECGATGTNYYWLYAHYRKVHPQIEYKVVKEKKHLCDQCGKSFSLRSGLLEHAPVHTGERPFACSQCGAAFTTKRKLSLHSETHKPPSRACTVCGKKFVSSSNLNNHMKGHIGDRRYKCSLCDKGFLHAAALREHERGVHQHVRREKKSRQGKQIQKD